MQPVYQDLLVTLYHGKQEDILPQLAITADMVLTDPPYGLTDLIWDTAPDLPLMWQHLRQCSKSNAVMALFCQQPFTTDLIVSNRKAWRGEWIWVKNRGIGFLWSKRKPLRAHEHIQVFIDEFADSIYNPQMRAGEPYTRIQKGGLVTHYRGVNKPTDVHNETGDRYPLTTLFYDNVAGNASQHETSKPLDLLEYLILTYTNPGDLILDPFIGSGSTAVAAAKLGRRCIGIEMREEALAVAVKRLAQQPLAILNL